MQKFTLLIGCFLLGCLPMDAQELRGVCGNTYADQMSQIDRYLANKKMAKTNPSKSRNAVTYIPIQFHVITRNNGTGGIKITDVLDQLCLLNNQFGAFDIIFYQADAPNVIANDVIYDNHTLTSGQFSMRQRRNREALNVWVVNDATPNSGGPAIGITLGYFDPLNDWIVIRKNQISGSNNTLAHEVGHFFSLFHPHLGWDAEPYTMATHGMQVGTKSPSGRDTELMDKSNCETAGDMICDTNPDYNFALTWNGCTFNVDVQDPNGDLVDPDESLIMSYFNDECTSKFTETQVEMMVADVASPSRNFLTRENYTPIATEITAIATLISPVESVVTSSFNKVELKWQAVAGADTYLVEVDRSSGFNIDNFKFIVSNQTSLLLEDILDADRNYRWRITPYNASYTCAPPSETARFRTGISTSVATIKTVNNWTIQPNPMTATSELTIAVNATTAFDADIKIFNLTGQLLQTQPATKFFAGNSKIHLAVSNLTKGVYFITLENAEGVLNKKLVIQ
ncbi:MAG: zinc-dependent metalloprotease [Saprospiraceae bacterium]